VGRDGAGGAVTATGGCRGLGPFLSRGGCGGCGRIAGLSSSGKTSRVVACPPGGESVGFFVSGISVRRFPFPKPGFTFSPHTQAAKNHGDPRGHEADRASAEQRPPTRIQRPRPSKARFIGQGPLPQGMPFPCVPCWPKATHAAEGHSPWHRGFPDESNAHEPYAPPSPSSSGKARCHKGCPALPSPCVPCWRSLPCLRSNPCWRSLPCLRSNPCWPEAIHAPDALRS
jgi:hypothetical protein